ncbi:hypothetical protein [Xenophilus sp. Marseille-Q4582]|uniref:hypothetical protein n=1 Tax=Xenophilus sp. Marseille-Q4582 TaxID=2866600 RepID=UPI001CE45718|nr:hypothetical protein [Xenophilus sp. Marseille-Q4582]
MGLFSSKYKTYVGTSAQRVIEDDNLPDASKQAILNAVLTNTDIVDSLLEFFNGSVGAKLEKVYEYAKTNYPIGLPSSYTKNQNHGREAAQAVIEQAEGQPVTVEYCRVGPPNMLHIGWARLQSEFGYQVETNTLKPPGMPADLEYWLVDMRPVIGSAQAENLTSQSLATWGKSPKAGPTPERRWETTAIGKWNYNPALDSVGFTEPLVKSGLIGEYMEVTYTFRHPDDRQVSPFGVETWPYRQDTFQIPVSGYDPEADYFHVCYLVDTQVKYVLYKVGEGTYPTLDAYYDFPEEEGEFFPRIYFRFMKLSMELQKDTPHYKTSKKMLKMLGMDYAQTIEAIHENPDIKDIETAFMHVAVPAVSENRIVNRYLYEFFDVMFYRQDHRERDKLNLFQRFALDPTNFSSSTDIGIMDAWMRTGVQHNGITKKRMAGKIGPKGTYISEESGYFQSTTYYVDTESGIPMEQVETTWVPVFYYRYQASEDTYFEIAVIQLLVVYWIQDKVAIAVDEDELGRKFNVLHIPVDRSICKNYPAKDKEDLYAIGLHFVFNSLIVQKIKWYQSSWFTALMGAVGVVLTVIGFGYGMEGFLAQLGTAITTGTVVQLLVNTVLKLVISNVVTDVIVKAVGPQLAGVLGIIAAAVGYLGKTTRIGIPMATELLAMGNSLITKAGEAVGELLQALKVESDTFNMIAELQLNQLEEINKQLDAGVTNLIDPLVIFGETPTDYMNRTVHSGNIGALTFDALHNYVDVALRLPSFNDTLGNTLNGNRV